MHGRVGALLCGIAVVVVGGFAAGAGFLNGDAAVYAVQAARGDLSERVVHVGYLAVAAGLAPLAGDALPLWLDRWAALSAGVVVACTGLRHRGWPAFLAAVVAASAVLPHAGYGEVDLHWVALIAVALVLPPPAAALACGLAVSVSPTALLALPWVAVERRDGAVVGGAVAVALLTVGSGGDWWFGDRGVWRGPPLLPGRTAEAWLHQLPWLAVGVWGLGWARAAREGEAGAAEGARRSEGMRALGAQGGPLLALCPLLLAPPDVPTVLVLALAVAHRVGEVPVGRVGAVLLAAQLALGALGAERAHRRVAAEDRLAREIAAQLTPQTGLIAPWTWGARISVHASGAPYGVVWSSPIRPVRDQAARWCAARPARVAVWAEDAVSWEDGEVWHRRMGCGWDTGL